VRAHPAHDGVVESLGRPGANLLGDFRECPCENDGDRRAGHEENPEDRVHVVRVLRDDSERAEDQVPDQAEASARLTGLARLNVSSVAGSLRCRHTS